MEPHAPSASPHRKRFVRVGAVSLIALLGTLLGLPSQPVAATTSAKADPRIAAAAQLVLDGLAEGNEVQIDLSRRLLADAVATASGADPVALEEEWVASGPARETVVFTALAQVGNDYQANGDSPDEGFDCSGLTLYAWSSVGVALSHNDGAQIAELNRVDRNAAAPGTLARWPGHIMLYVGADTVVHAANSGVPVMVGKVQTGKTLSWADPLA